MDRNASRPLADRLRPKTLGDIVGQDHLVAEDAPIGRMAQNGKIASMILWGPPGCGKTTLAKILSQHTDQHFEMLSAIFSGVGDLRKVFDTAKMRREQGKGTLLFIDEIHRFNKSQQDAFLPVVEDGTITLIGATTENPSFELNGALLSRCQVFVLKRLDDTGLEKLLQRAEEKEGKKLPLDKEARETLKTMADGDGRHVLTLVEQIFALLSPSSPPKRGPGDSEQEGSLLAQGKQESMNREALMALLQKRAPLYDKSDDGHYNLISALHKSVRGSDPDAALYWFARMLEGGEDPKFLARRLVVMAAEDISLADPHALPLALAAAQAYDRLGSPEGEIPLAEAVVYLATAPKSNATYLGLKKAKVAARATGSLMPPKHILNAPTELMKQQEYGAGYKYDHDTPEGFSGQNYFPDEMEREELYTPYERGFEREIIKRLDYWKKLRDKKAP